MSKDVDSRTVSKISIRNAKTTSASTSNADTPSTNSEQSSKCAFVSYSKNPLKLEDASSSSTTASSTKTRDNHYITRVQPKSASCSFSPLDSDKTVVPDENDEYSWKLRKEMSVQLLHRELAVKKSSTNGSSTEDTFEVIPLTNLLEDADETEATIKPNDTSGDVGKDSNPKEVPKSCNRSLGPRMTTSDSFISINRKHFQERGRKCFLPTEADVKSWEHPCPSEKPPTVPNKWNESEQTSSSTPVSIFENEKYKTFTDSNSHEDDIIESIKSENARKKCMSGKESKKGIEVKNSSLLSIPSTVCRICHTNTVNERSLSPCYCKGSSAYVHLSCLERWSNQSSRSYCESCSYQYNAVETLRYGFLEGIRSWVRHPRNRNHVKSDCLIAFLLTLVTLGLVVICFIGMDYFMIEGIKSGSSKMWTKSFIVSFLSVIMMGYVVTMYSIVKDQFVPWYTWWKNTSNIRLSLSPTVMQTQRI